MESNLRLPKAILTILLLVAIFLSTLMERLQALVEVKFKLP